MINWSFVQKIFGQKKTDEARYKLLIKEKSQECQTIAHLLLQTRTRILNNPNLLIGCQPSIDAVWGYVSALTHSREKLLGRKSSWSSFLKYYKRYGSKTEYRVMVDDHDSFEDQIFYLKSLYQDYENWATD